MRRKGRDAVDELLPGYADLHEIGGGAFATVFRATELQTRRPVALKILKVDTVHAQLIETFHREIHALAAVSDHPYIVTLYRPATTVDGRPALVLELCRESLGDQLRRGGPVDPVEVTRTGIKIAGALETAHRNGFLHRDMKPQNILVTQFGEPALADFGVAALQASAQATAGVFGFTTLHAAPEMLEGLHLSPAT
ncbi:MAG TPA: serine/threonine-protein kinase, partial [Acidimicrobiales bacterium]|nr:serine/threonine-protein kinase [Acidimicrobiales bacterium]